MCRSQLHSLYPLIFFLSFFHETAPSMIYTLSLHDALPIWELVILESIQARVSSEGRPHLVTVYGDAGVGKSRLRSEEHTSELQSLTNLVCRLLLEKKNKKNKDKIIVTHKKNINL